MIKRLILILVTAGILAFIPNSAFAYTVDGSLADWGVRPGAYTSSQWVPNPGVFYTEEDQINNYLFPGYGGQTFDAEAMYIDFDTENLYFAVVTGYPNPQNGTTWAAGDIAFDFGIDDTYPYGDSYEYGIETVGNGLTQGTLYHVATWGQGLHKWDTVERGYISAPTEILTVKAGEPTTAGSLVYVRGFEDINGTKSFYVGNHYVIEGSVPLDGFGDDWGRNFRMHWTQTCGNDFIYKDVIIPEPATLSLLGLGLLGLVVIGKKKVNKRS